MTAAPASRAATIAGSEARMRVSSVMLPAFVLRHVEVGADEYPLALEIEIGKSLELHRDSPAEARG
jgi:hypothetical protein